MLFVVGDIHGELDKLKKLLTQWNSDKQRLVFLGDYIDRGKDSCGVIQFVSKLCKEFGAVAIGGNHEDMFLQWLDHPEDKWFQKWMEDPSILNYEEEAGMSESIMYYSNGGDCTIDSFYVESCAYRYLPSRHAAYIKSNFAEEVKFLRSLPHYFEWKDQYVCVHAGVNLAYADWRKTSDTDFRWIRTPFHFMRNETGRIFIFGHNPTRFLHPNKSDDVWISPCRTKIGIDGGAVFGGLLHGVIVGDERLVVHSVEQTGELLCKEIVL